MRGSNSNNNNDNNQAAAAVKDWEVRPGGMLVQKREDEDGSGPAAAGGPMINIKVCHGTSQLDVSVPAQSTFGELKRVLAKVTGLEPQDQRLLFRGKEKDNEECLHMAGVKDMSKIVLLEDPASKEQKLEQMKMEQGFSKACEAVVLVRSEVDKLAEKVTALESAVHGGTKVEEKEFLVLTELLMAQLLKLDGTEAEGEAKVQRRMEHTEFGGCSRCPKGKKLQSLQQQQQCRLCDNPMGDVRLWSREPEFPSADGIIYSSNQQLGTVRLALSMPLLHELHHPQRPTACPTSSTV